MKSLESLETFYFLNAPPLSHNVNLTAYYYHRVFYINPQDLFHINTPWLIESTFTKNIL